MRLVADDGERQLPRVAVATVGSVEGSRERERLLVARERQVERGEVIVPQCFIRPEMFEHVDTVLERSEPF